MTILQLKYIIVTANSGSFREAASKLFISQPALSATIKELEEELDVKLFERTNKGIRLTKQGEEFLIYAKEAVSQYELIEDRYLNKGNDKIHFSVSMQHYVFAVHAFVNVVKKYDSDRYTYSVYETRTDKVLSDVKNLKSEIGVISYSNSNQKVMKKLLREYNLKFVPLMVRDACVYVWKKHPLAKKKKVSIKDLVEYPCLSFDQSSKSDFYLSEEALGDYDFGKIIKSNDRATIAELMSTLNGYAIGTGNMTDSYALKDEFLTLEIDEEDPLTIGYIVRDNHEISEMGKSYIEELEKYKQI